MKKVVALGVLVFLYLPLAILCLFSFNEGRSPMVWEGFSLRWYRALFQDARILDALLNSLAIAALSTLIATVLGTMVALGLYRHRFWGSRILRGILQLPIVLPDIVLGISTLCMLMLFRFALGIYSIVLAHVTFCISFVALIVLARLASFDRNLEGAARDLGASEWQTVRFVTLPLLAPSIVAGALISFVLSFDDFTIAFFTAGVGSTTLPVRAFSMLHFGVTPIVNALSVMIIMVSFVLVFSASRLQRDSIVI